MAKRTKKSNIDKVAMKRAKTAAKKTSAKIKYDKRQQQIDRDVKLGSAKGKTARQAAALAAVTTASSERERTIRQQSADRASVAKAAIDKWNGIVTNMPETDVDSGSSGNSGSNDTGTLNPQNRW